jgi:hypothetical protein
VETFAEAIRQFVELVGTIDLDGLTGGVVRYLAVLATMQMLLQLGTYLGGHRVVDQVIEQS